MRVPGYAVLHTFGDSTGLRTHRVPASVALGLHFPPGAIKDRTGLTLALLYGFRSDKRIARRSHGAKPSHPHLARDPAELA